MKKIKISFAILALLFVIGSAFTKSADFYFYEFRGDPAEITEVKDYLQYFREDVGCDDQEGDLCGIFLTVDQSQPPSAFSTTVQNNLWSSVQNNESQDPGIIIMKP